MDDDFGGDEVDFLAVSASFARVTAPATGSASRLDAPTRPATSGAKVQQPKPQALPARNAPSSILVSPRQKGNPILANIRSLPWEYSDIPADYVLGATTCALFLSLKYHRLHPEYIYQRIRALAGKYNLRIILTMVDIQNHEEPLKELSKTSLINNVTIVLCWSAQEAGRYLELFKSYEHAAPTAIRAHQSTGYSDKLVEFITVPRSINKTDAVSLISSFGSVRTAMNAAPEDVALVPGFGEKKVQRWCSTVREPFRVRKAAKRGVLRTESTAGVSRNTPEAATIQEESTIAANEDLRMTAKLDIARSTLEKPQTNGSGSAPNALGAPDRNSVGTGEPDEDEMLALLEASREDVSARAMAMPKPVSGRAQKVSESVVSDGVAAALARLRRDE